MIGLITASITSTARCTELVVSKAFAIKLQAFRSLAVACFALL
jgi:hypothetical protein